jgi:hypothetical protein
MILQVLFSNLAKFCGFALQNKAFSHFCDVFICKIIAVGSYPPLFAVFVEEMSEKFVEKN